MRNNVTGSRSTMATPRVVVFALLTAVLLLHPVHSARAALDVWREFRADR